MNTKITVVYNNILSNKNLMADWGFSAVIEEERKKILFDAGGEGSILISNMEILGINMEEIDTVFLSHIHRDHTGGLKDFLKINNNTTIYLPRSFPEHFKENLKDKCREIKEVSAPGRLCGNLWTTGELGSGKIEQSLVLDTPRGLIIIAGCAHPGIVKIVKHVKNKLNKNVHLLVGGFHLGYIPYLLAKIKIKQLKSLGVEKVAPSHCNKEKAINYFKKIWKEDFIDLGCGGGATI